jgi:hypothetical protein
MLRAIVGCVPICVCSSSLGGGRSARGIRDVRSFVKRNGEMADKYKCALENGRKRKCGKTERIPALKYQSKKEKNQTNPPYYNSHTYTPPPSSSSCLQQSESDSTRSLPLSHRPHLAPPPCPQVQRGPQTQTTAPNGTNPPSRSKSYHQVPSQR